MPPTAVPVATYRLQFSASFTFDAAPAIVDYLDALGISHGYASSDLAAVPGSTHGYDVADPTRLNPGGAGRYRHVFTNRCVAVRQDGDRGALQAVDVFEHFPIAFLEQH